MSAQSGGVADWVPPAPVVDVHQLEAAAAELKAQYCSASPFPHIVIDDFLTPETALAAAEEFPSRDTEWISYLHVNERKYANTQPDTWGPTLQSILAELQSPEFVRVLSRITGIDGLLADDTIEGGGLHQSFTGGYLQVHADFTVHPKVRNWQRRVNLLLYFNPDWEPEYGGDLELWSKDMKRLEKKISPLLSRAVIFNTDFDSFHGHPEPMRSPEGLPRQSLALYYFTEEVAPRQRSTEYRARPGDGLRAIPIFIDKSVLRAFDTLKRRLHWSDDRAGRWLKRLDRIGGRKRP